VSISRDGVDSANSILGLNSSVGERPQIVVPKGAWQSARSLGTFTLAGCTVAPGFQFSGFEMAPPDWRPRAAS
jgi:predicted cupin superfamily sugar epimerase